MIGHSEAQARSGHAAAARADAAAHCWRPVAPQITTWRLTRQAFACSRIRLHSFRCCCCYCCSTAQIYDVEIDAVNKPFLPVAAGELSQGAAWALCLLLAAGEGPVGLGLLCLAVFGLGFMGSKSSCAVVPVLTRIVLSGHFAWPALCLKTCLPLTPPTLPRRRGHHEPQLWQPDHRPLLLRPVPGHHLLGAAPAPQALRHRGLHDHRHRCALCLLRALRPLWSACCAHATHVLSRT